MTDNRCATLYSWVLMLMLALVAVAALLCRPDAHTGADELDTDGDGFTDVQEAYLGTLPYAWCPVAHGPGTVPVRVHPFTLDGWNQTSWPPDLNNDGIVNVGDLLVYNPTIATGRGFSYMPDGSLLAPERRLNLHRDAGSQVVNIADWLTVGQYMGRHCE